MRKRFADSYHWKWPLYAGLAACAVYLPIILISGDLSLEVYWVTILSVVLCAAFVATIFLLTASWKTALSLISSIFVSVFVNVALMLCSHDIRNVERWNFHAFRHKTLVLCQPSSPQRDYRHIEWDVWGWGGNDTYVYLVYDPLDQLADSKTITANGQPCEVADVHRLEKSWYRVTFYTDAQWNDCR